MTLLIIRLLVFFERFFKGEGIYIINMNKENVAIIIPAYNAEKYIERCLNSILNQTYRELLIYVIDDGSSDKTFEIVKKIAENDKRIIAIHTENRGMFFARRMAIDMINDCKYSMFVDSDDFLLNSNIIFDSIAKMEEQDVDVLCFNYVHSGKRGFKGKKEILLTSKEEIIGSMMCRTIIDGNLPYAVYKTDLVRNGVWIRYYRNDDFLNKYDILANANKVLYEPWDGYYYFENVSSQTHRPICVEDFIYYEHVKAFTDEINRQYPSLSLECEYFELWVLLWLGVSVLKEKEYKKNVMYYKVIPIINKCFRHYLNNNFFVFKEKLNVILIYMNLYSFVYRCYHRIFS